MKISKKFWFCGANSTIFSLWEGGDFAKFFVSQN
jgi:hypothetical protein